MIGNNQYLSGASSINYDSSKKMDRQQRCWWCPLHSHLPFLLSSPQATLVPTNCSAKSPTPSLAPNRQAICCPHFLDTLLFLDFLIPQSSDVPHHPGCSWSVSRLLRDSTSKSRRAPRICSTHLLSVLCVTCMSGWYTIWERVYCPNVFCLNPLGTSSSLAPDGALGMPRI